MQLNGKTKNELSHGVLEQNSKSILQMFTRPPKPVQGGHDRTRGSSAAQPGPKGPTQRPDHRPRKQWCLGWYSFRCASDCFLNSQLPIWIQITEGGPQQIHCLFFQLLVSAFIKWLDKPLLLQVRLPFAVSWIHAAAPQVKFWPR